MDENGSQMYCYLIDFYIFYIYDFDKDKTIKVDQQKWMYEGDLENFSVSWSSDSRYLTYGKELDSRTTAIAIFDTKDEIVHQVTAGYYNDLKEVNKDLINQSSTPIIHRKLKKYKRQYFGYIDGNGDRILLINCFWSKNRSDSEIWLRNRIIVNDGGSYYWNIKFNLDKNALFELVVNGYS